MNSNQTEPARIREIAVSRWWNSADLSAPFETVDGQSVQVVYRGTWSHGLGPDFQNAMLAFADSHLISGSVEIHLTTAAWRQHGHHLDPRYNDVVLHIALEHDGSETRRADGRIVPVVIIDPDAALLAILQEQEFDWHLVGGEVCAEPVARADPAAIREVLWLLGDQRLSDKVASLSARLDGELPADLLFESIMDGLGYSSNREPMRLLAARMPVGTIDALLATVSLEDRYALAAGLLLGAAGYLPLAPTDAEMARFTPVEVAQIERFWHSHGVPWHHDLLPPSVWNRTRVRPANHPVVRLAMAAALLTSTFEGFTATVVQTVRAGEDPVALLMERSTHGDRPGMGTSRATAIVANAIVPVLLALAESTGDVELSEQTSACWEHLPAGESNEITRRAMKQVAGSVRIGSIGERGMQGLIHLDRQYCAPRRCLECPIAWLALSRQSTLQAATLE